MMTPLSFFHNDIYLIKNVRNKYFVTRWYFLYLKAQLLYRMATMTYIESRDIFIYVNVITGAREVYFVYRAANLHYNSVLAKSSLQITFSVMLTILYTSSIPFWNDTAWKGPSKQWSPTMNVTDQSDFNSLQNAHVKRLEEDIPFNMINIKVRKLK